MLPYRSLWSNIAYCHEMLPVRPGDHIVSMLPLGHVFGMVYDFLYGFSAGAHLYFPHPHAVAKDYRAVILRNQAARHILRAAHRREDYQEKHPATHRQQDRQACCYGMPIRQTIR